MRKVSIIIPAYNESRTLPEIISRVYAVALPNWQKEVIVVDDGSTDNSEVVLKELAFKYLDLKVVQKSNGGKGSAIKKGLDFVTGDYVLIQDADLECDPADYPKLLAPITEASDISVMGSRNIVGSNEMKKSGLRYGNLALTKIFNILIGSKLTDITGCYKVFPSHIIDKVRSLPSNDFVFDAIELTYTMLRNTKVVEVPVHYYPRTVSDGKKLRIKDGFKCLKGLIKLVI